MDNGRLTNALNAYIEQDDLEQVKELCGILMLTKQQYRIAVRTAIEHHATSVFPYMIEKGFLSHVYVGDSLELAAEKGYLDFVKLIYGHRVISQSLTDDTFSVAMTYQKPDVYTYLYKTHQANIHYNNGLPFASALQNEDEEAMRFIIQHTADPNDIGDIPLKLLTTNDYFLRAFWIIEQGLDLTLRSDFPFAWIMRYLGLPETTTPLNFMRSPRFREKYRERCLTEMT